MAHALGMALNHYLANTTHRQHLTWVEWLRQELNNPDLVCHYLMQLCYHLQRANAKHPEFVEFPRDQLIRFGGKGGGEEMTAEELAEQVAHDRSLWHGAGHAATMLRRQEQGNLPGTPDPRHN